MYGADNFVVDYGTTTLTSRSFTTWPAALKCARAAARRGNFATVGTTSGALLRTFKPRNRR
jgi:hypothetical protein